MEEEGIRDFSFALQELNKWNSVYSNSWNGVGLWGSMFIAKQKTTDKSKMTVSYLYMTIEETDKPTIVVPRTPSQKDLRTTDWFVL